MAGHELDYWRCGGFSAHHNAQGARRARPPPAVQCDLRCGEALAAQDDATEARSLRREQPHAHLQLSAATSSSIAILNYFWMRPVMPIDGPQVETQMEQPHAHLQVREVTSSWIAILDHFWARALMLIDGPRVEKQTEQRHERLQLREATSSSIEILDYF
jgi:hypothetical protein